MLFDGSYCEDRRLRDGTQVHLRLVAPEDKIYLQRGLEKLSPHSQYLRFFTEKPRFTAAELRYLTEYDLRDHVAIGVLTRAGEGGEGTNAGTDGDRDPFEGVALGRFVRHHDEPEVAEPALVVVDAYQGRGLGGLLFERLIQGALERDIIFFRTTFLSSNGAMRRVLDRVAPNARARSDGQLLSIELDLRETTVGAGALMETGLSPKLT